MIKLNTLRKVAGIAVLFISMNMLTSCNGCSNPGSNDTGTSDGNEANGDTDGSPRPGGNENSGSTQDSDTRSGTTGGNSSDN